MGGNSVWMLWHRSLLEPRTFSLLTLFNTIITKIKLAGWEDVSAIIYDALRAPNTNTTSSNQPKTSSSERIPVCTNLIITEWMSENA